MTPDSAAPNASDAVYIDECELARRTTLSPRTERRHGAPVWSRAPTATLGILTHHPIPGPAEVYAALWFGALWFGALCQRARR